MRLSLRTKWLLALLLVGAAPLVLLAKLGLDIQQRWLEETERELESAVADEASENVSLVLDDLESATADVGRSLTDPHVTSDEARVELARRAVAGATGIDYVAVYGPDGAFVDAISAGTERRSTGAPAHLDPQRAGLGHKLLPVAFENGTVDVFWVERMTVGEEVRGYTLGRVDPDKLEARLVALSRARFAQPDRLVLVDHELRFVAGAGRKKPGDAMPELAGVGDAMAGEGLAKTFPFADASGTRMVGTLRAIPKRELGVFVSRPEAEAFAVLAEARRALLLAAFVLVIVAIAAGVWLSRTATKPILSLVALTNKYAKRDFLARAGIHTGDEIESLAVSMEGMAGSLASSEKEILRRAAVENSLSRYMPEAVARSIAKGESKLSLGGERRSVSVVFADVAGFTTFAEGAPPEQVTAFLNELFTVLSEVVFRHDGMVDKFMGDCVMAVFGSDGKQGHALAAMRAAEDMQRFVEASSPSWQETYGFEVKLGIGVATGAALVGNLGSETRMEYTAVGDTVNVASRLEALARPGQTLVTADVAQAVRAEFSFRSLGPQPLRGKRQQVEILELEGNS